MLELKFAKEPFDFKLFVLRFLQKIWIVLVAMVIGMVLFGVGHYLAKVVFSGPAQYQITTSYYVDYYMNPETGVVDNYINEATWESLIDTDWFIDRVWDYSLENGEVLEKWNVKRDDLTDFLSADLLTDIRMPCSMVVTESPELTSVLNEAVQLTFKDFGKQQPEMLDVRILDETPLKEKDKDVRTLRACILGALLGAFFGCVGVSFVIIMDDTIIIPEVFTYRYAVPMLGVLGAGEKELSEEAGANIRYRFREKKDVAMITLRQQDSVPQCPMPEGFKQVKENTAEAYYEALRQSDGVLLWVEAGVNSGKGLEHLLHELAVQDIPVQGAVLYNGNRKLLKAYRMGSKQK